jgi:hypothetical protein
MVTVIGRTSGQIEDEIHMGAIAHAEFIGFNAAPLSQLLVNVLLREEVMALTEVRIAIAHQNFKVSQETLL